MTKKHTIVVKNRPKFVVNDDGTIIELFKTNKELLDIQMCVSSASLFGYNKDALFHVIHTVEFPTAVIVDVFGHCGRVPEDRMKTVRKIYLLDEEAKT